MKKCVLIIILSVIFGQDFVPNNNQSLNQTQIFFKWPQINNSILYRLYINDNQNFYESDSNSIIINDFEWDSAYSWYVCGFNNSNNMIDCYGLTKELTKDIIDEYMDKKKMMQYQN